MPEGKTAKHKDNHGMEVQTMTIKEKLVLLEEIERRNRERVEAWKKQQAK